MQSQRRHTPVRISSENNVPTPLIDERELEIIGEIAEQIEKEFPEDPNQDGIAPTSANEPAGNSDPIDHE